MSKPGNELVVVVAGKDLLKRLFEDALSSRDPDRMVDYLDVIERVFPRMHREYGKTRAFAWPEVPAYVPQIPPALDVIDERYEAAAATLLRDADTILSEGSPRFRDLFDDTIKTDPI